MVEAAQRAAVQDVFKAAGFSGELRTLPLESGDEACFIFEQPDLFELGDPLALEETLSRLLGRGVWLLASVGDATVPFAGSVDTAAGVVEGPFRPPASAGLLNSPPASTSKLRST